MRRAVRRREFILTAAGLGAAVGLAACGKSGNSTTPGASGAASSSGEITGEVKVTFQQFGNSKVQANFLNGWAKKFTAAHPQATVKLQPIVASENDYYTKLQLSMRSPRTAPDMCYEDTFLINSDIAAGYLTALDDRISSWPDWSQFKETAKTAAQALDGKTYGIPDGTDVRALWFNKKIFEKAGLPTDWQPKSWNDIITAAQTIKQKVPGVIPLNVYAGTGVGEAASMQGFEMLLYGIPTGTLFDKQSQKWVVDSKAFTDALTAYEQVWNPGLGPTPQQALAPTWANTVAQELLPQQKLAIDLDGSWLSNNWLESGAAPWPEWHTVLGNAYMPTQNGEGSGKVTMSGGWTWAIPKNAQNANAAWEFIKMLTSKEGELEYDIKNVQIPVRTDVAKDPSYLKANPTNPFFSDLVESTIYRPAYAEYAKISLLLQQATEKVITKTATPDAAAKFYADGVRQIVGQDKTTTI
jgi:multiple sugar transport system substrate-binding protein